MEKNIEPIINELLQLNNSAQKLRLINRVEWAYNFERILDTYYNFNYVTQLSQLSPIYDRLKELGEHL